MMNLKNLRNISIPLILFLALLHFEYNDIYNECSFLFKNIVELIRNIIEFLHENNIANIILVIFISYISVKCIIKRYKDEYIDINHIIVLLFILFEIHSHNIFSLNIIAPIEYKHLILLFLFLYLLVIPIKVVILKFTKKKEKKTSSFVTDTAPDSIINIGWDNYVQNLVNILKHTDLTRNVFSVGISSEWGSGKTVFLEMIENEMKDSFLIIKFNPWNSNDANHIVRDYFNLLKDSLSPYNSKLANPLSKYMKVLSNIKFKDTFFESTKNLFLNNSSDNNINTLKDNVEECILQLKKPVVVFIDDLDRLKDDELFEVLKLIRTTAQFKNMVYIVAFDRGYTANMLESKNINDGYKYIEKIFNVEITLPYYERNILEEYMLQEFKLLLDESCFEQISKVVRGKIFDKYKVSVFFKNFREIKRFINQFILNFNTIYNGTGINDIVVSELFKLELIHFFDNDFYQLLKNNPKEFLFVSRNGLMSEICIGKKDLPKSYDYDLFKNDYIKTFKKEPTEKVFYIFDDLFTKKYYNVNNNSITFSYNYYKYFSLRIMRNQITDKEFNEFISSSEPEQILEKFQGKHDSLAYHFRTYRLAFIGDFNRLKLFYDSFFHWINKSDNTYIYDIFRIKTDKDSIQKKLQEQVGYYIIEKIEWLIEKSTSSNDRIKVTTLLKRMYMLSFFDYGDREESFIHESLVTNEKIIELANKNFELFLKENSNITPQDIVDKDSLLYRFAINSVLKETVDSQGKESAVNIILNSLTEFFIASKKYDPKVILKYFSFRPKDFYEDETEYNYDRQMFFDKIETIFGSVKQYKKFISISMPRLDKSYLQKYTEEQKL